MKIKELRLRTGLTQAEFAKKIPASVSTIYNAENGKASKNLILVIKSRFEEYLLKEDKPKIQPIKLNKYQQLEEENLILRDIIENLKVLLDKHKINY